MGDLAAEQNVSGEQQALLGSRCRRSGGQDTETDQGTETKTKTDTESEASSETRTDRSPPSPRDYGVRGGHDSAVSDRNGATQPGRGSAARRRRHAASSIGAGVVNS